MTIDSTQPGNFEIQQTGEALQLLNRNLAVSIQWSLLVPLVIGFAFHETFSWQGALLWTGLFYLVMLPRLWIAKDLSQKPLPLNEEQLGGWGHQVMISSLCGGLVWASSTFVFFDSGRPEQQVILLTIVYAISLISLMMAAYWLPAFYIFVTPLLGGQILFFGFISEARYRMMAVVSLLLLVVLIKIGKSTHNLAQNVLSLRFQNLRLVDKLIREKNSVEFASMSKSRFLAAAGHDLRQPVHSLTMLAEALRGEVKTRVAKELVENVNASVGSLDNLLTDLLDISRLDAGLVNDRKLPVNIRPIVESIVEDLRPQADTANLYLRVRLSDTYVYSDPLLLATIIRKLIGNAVKFTRHGGVLVGLRRRSDKVLLQVWDSGPGIAKESYEDIFIEFHQLSSVRQYSKGLGLGLSIGKRLAGLLGHDLRLRSRVGKGSVFELELARISPQNVIPVTAGSARQVSLRGRRLLIVDNEPGVLQGTLAVLKGWQCEVDTASNAREALAQLESGKHYDGYICDYNLGPGANGLELLARLHELDGGHTPGIIVTGNTDPALIGMASKAGHIVLYKPVKPAQLRALLMRQKQHLQPLPESIA